MSDLLPAVVAFLADTLETENHLYAPLARRASLDAGMPSAAGVQALYDLQAELNEFEDWFSA